MHISDIWCLDADISTVSVKCEGGNDGIIIVKISESQGEYTIRLMDATNNKLIKSQNLVSDTTISFFGCNAGKYIVQIISGSNSNLIDAVVHEPAKLEAEFIEIDTVFGKGDQASVNIKLVYKGGTPPYSIQWTENANNQKGEIATVVDLGIYSCMLNDNNGCGPVSATFFLFEDEIEKYYQKYNPQDENK